jgi:hypothetical protein
MEKYALKRSGGIDSWVCGAEAVRDLKERVARLQVLHSREEPLHRLPHIVLS